ncbi:MAG: pyridine nucleotide-disulfide oxidoreductase [Hyphomicrobiales bacterium]|nr:MAG: pyridine nucleotide-disulfide oxidoreductase [Hyphomicrobiales bacterium]
MTKTVIIGGSHAAIAAAAKLRQLNADMEIVIISEEGFLPYQRPPLSKAYMAGVMPIERLCLKPAQWFEKQRIGLQLNAQVTSIDPDKKQLQLASGGWQSYDKLLLATGATARCLPADIGGHLPNVRTMRNLSDANWLIDNMQADKNLIVIGGGYIGLEAAAEAAKKGLNVTIIEAADRILKRVACAETSDEFRRLHQQKNVRILENTQLLKIIEENGIACDVRLSSGEVIALDFIVVGIGVTANVELAQNAGIKTLNGIIVDEYCRTSHADIYAAGDCVSLPFDQQPTRLESVQNAHDQGAIAAANILGNEIVYNPKPWFWSDQFEIKLQIAGLNRGYDAVIVKHGKREGAVSHYYFAQQKLIAVDSLNDPATYAMVRKALEANVVIEQEMVMLADFDIREKVKTLMAG